MFKKSEPSSINDDILSQGFGPSNDLPEDAVVIDASDTRATAPPSKKRKLQRVATVAGAGFVLLGVAAAIVTLQNKPVAVDPVVDAVLNKPPAPASKLADVAVAATTLSQPTTSGEPAAPAPAAAATQLSGAAVSAPVASPASLEKQTTQTATATVAQTPSTTQVDAAKRLGELDKSYLDVVEALAKLAMRLDDVTATQKELKRDIERLTKAQQATTAQVEKRALAPVAAKPAQQEPSKSTRVAATERIEKAVSMKELNILAMTTESIIFGPQGKEQEVFVGAAMPGLNGKLETVDPQNRTIVTSTRIYKVTH